MEYIKLKLVVATIVLVTSSTAYSLEPEERVTAAIGYGVVLESKAIDCRNDVLSGLPVSSSKACDMAAKVASLFTASVSDANGVIRRNSKVGAKFGPIFMSIQESAFIELTKMMAVQQVMTEGLK